MKKVILIFAMVLVAAITFGQNTVDVDQSGSNPMWATGLINDAGVQQDGSNIDLDIDQVAGDWNGIRSAQSGTNLSITLDAWAGTFNDGSYGAPRGFLQSGMNSDIDVEQIATTGSNTVIVWQQSGLGYIGDNNDIDVVQEAGNSNFLHMVQYGQDHIVNLDQTAGVSNSAVTYQGSWGSLQTNNVLYGATKGLWGPEYNPAGGAELLHRRSACCQDDPLLAIVLRVPWQ